MADKLLIMGYFNLVSCTKLNFRIRIVLAEFLVASIMYVLLVYLKSMLSVDVFSLLSLWFFFKLLLETCSILIIKNKGGININNKNLSTTVKYSSFFLHLVLVVLLPSNNNQELVLYTIPLIDEHHIYYYDDKEQEAAAQ